MTIDYQFSFVTGVDILDSHKILSDYHEKTLIIILCDLKRKGQVPFTYFHYLIR